MKTQVYLQSQNSTYTLNSSNQNSDLIFYFHEPITRPFGNDMKISLSSFVFPVSFYLVDSNNNQLVVNSTTYTLTNGNYSAKNLATHIKSLLGSSYTITYDSITNKYTFSHTTTDFTINSTSTCLTLLGFSSASHTSTSLSLVSDTVVNLSGQYNVLYVDISNILTNNISSLTGRRTSIVESIPVTVPYGSVMYYENKASSSHSIQEDIISYIHVRILKEDMLTPVDFQGQDWNMTIEFGFESSGSDLRNFNDLLNSVK